MAWTRRFLVTCISLAVHGSADPEVSKFMGKFSVPAMSLARPVSPARPVASSPTVSHGAAARAPVANPAAPSSANPSPLLNMQREVVQLEAEHFAMTSELQQLRSRITTVASVKSQKQISSTYTAGPQLAGVFGIIVFLSGSLYSICRLASNHPSGMRSGNVAELQLADGGGVTLRVPSRSGAPMMIGLSSLRSMFSDLFGGETAQPQRRGRRNFNSPQGRPPRRSPNAPPTLLQQARVPFMLLTLLVTAGLVGWQIRGPLQTRESRLLSEFAENMVRVLGDEATMRRTYWSFRTRLGPGRFTSRMATSFLTVLVRNREVDIKTLQDTQKALSILRASDNLATLRTVAEEVEREQGALNNLIFIAERTMPKASRAANLRSKLDDRYVEARDLQQVMLEKVFRRVWDKMPDNSLPDEQTLKLLDLSDSEATRLMDKLKKQREEEAEATQAAIRAARKAKAKESRFDEPK